MPGIRDKKCLSLKKLFPRLETTVDGADKTKYKVSISSRDEGD